MGYFYLGIHNKLLVICFLVNLVVILIPLAHNLILYCSLLLKDLGQMPNAFTAICCIIN